MEIGLVQRINIDEEMQQAYLDYAMSVIVARALPDARDGLKPVHRRILYAMYDMGIRPDTPYKKSARIVGEVLGKYHPHGDMAVYEAMARMAQDFSMRYPLVDGQGNFGSVDGDEPAAMRYTEARLARTAMQMLGDIQKNTVNFDDNFDGTLTEPGVLPSAVPNLLVNGATGIAVGMATSIPPHNLIEVIDAIHFMLENWDKSDDLTVEDLMAFVQGPDFPTGGIIIHEEESDSLVSAYSTGRGRVTVQASAHLEEMERGRSRIIITELPYMTNKSSLIERIASLVREERLEGIADLRDESDRQGMRIVIELNKTAEPETVLSNLFKNTPMQSTFGINILALVDGEPRLLSLKQSLRVFIEHRLEIVRRRSEFDLEKARQRAHILEGLLIALNNLDEIISLIRKSPDAEIARDRLIKRFKLTTIQAQAILDMPLRRLAALERKKIEQEYKEVKEQIKELEALLRSPKKMRQVVDQELQTIKETFGDRRRTHIARLKAGVPRVSMLTATDLKPDKTVWVSVSTDGLISRSQDDQAPPTSGEDAPLFLAQTSTRDTLYLITNQGDAAAIAVHALPEATELQAGLPLHKVSPLKEGQVLSALLALPAKERRTATGDEGYILTITRQGMLKKSSVAELPGPSATTFTLAKVNHGDQLGWVRLTNGHDDLVLVSATGMAIRFNEEEVRPMGLVAAGVMGIKLQLNDELAGVEVLPLEGDLFLLANDGSAKRIPFDHFSRQGRNGQGLIAWKLPAKVYIIAAASGKGARRIILHLSRLAPKAIRLDEAPLMSRTARGQSILESKIAEQVVAICVPWISSLSYKQAEERLAPEVLKTRTQAKSNTTVEKPPAKATPAKTPRKATTTTDKSAEKVTPSKPLTKAAPAKTPAQTTTTPAKPAAKATITKTSGESSTTTDKPATKDTPTKVPTRVTLDKTSTGTRTTPAKPATKATPTKTPTKTTPGKSSAQATKTPAKPAAIAATKMTPTKASTTAEKPAEKATPTKSITKTTPGKTSANASKTPAKPAEKATPTKAPTKATPGKTSAGTNTIPAKPAAKATTTKVPMKANTTSDKPVAKATSTKAPSKTTPGKKSARTGTTPAKPASKASTTKTPAKVNMTAEKPTAKATSNKTPAKVSTTTEKSTSKATTSKTPAKTGAAANKTTQPYKKPPAVKKPTG